MNHMKKWKKALALTGGMAVLTAVLAGCQMKKYEEIPLPETTVKSSYEAEGDTMEEETEKKEALWKGSHLQIQRTSPMRWRAVQ